MIIEPKETTVARERSEEESRQQQERNLVAQERMASAACFSAVLVFLGTVALIWTLHETRKAARAAVSAANAANSANDLAQTALSIQQRPWIGMGDGNQVPWMKIGPDGQPHLVGFMPSLPLVNLGNTPATEISYYADTKFTGPNGPVPVIDGLEQKNLRANPLFPGMKHLTVRTPLSLERIAEMEKGALRIFICMSINYRSAHTTDKFYTTEAVVELTLAGWVANNDWGKNPAWDWSVAPGSERIT